MDRNQQTTSDRPVRASAVHGAIVAIAALLGADCAITAGTVIDRAPRTASITARVISPAASAVRACTPTFTWTATALLILLVAGGQLVWNQPLARPYDEARSAALCDPASRLRRSNSISYHSGGLYGP
jgi:hypothetical protein